MAWRRKDDASTSAIGLAVATATFAIAFVAANVMIAEPAGVDRRGAALDASATNALDVIIGQAGRASGGGSWLTSADSLSRFGLAEEGQPNFLDYRKIKSMRNATMTTTANSAPDYPDVRSALGIDEVDFHLRTYPVIPGLEDPRWTKDPRGRLAYVGHVDAASGAATATSYANTSSTLLTVEVAIRNDGATSHIFLADISIGNIAGDDVIKTERRHTTPIAPGTVQTVKAQFPKMAYAPALTGVKVDITDGYGNLLIEGTWKAATAPTGGSNLDFALLMTAGDTYYETGEKVTFQADHFEGDGTRKNQAQNGRFVLVGPNGKEWVNTTSGVSLPKNKPYNYECSNCTAVGTYTATIWDTGLTRRATDIVHVSATPLFTESETLAALATKEITLVGELVANFNPVEHDPTTEPEGDLFTDAAHIRDLDDVLSRYTVLVVGSEVRQNALNSGEIKWAIADWVQDGGNLIVLGTVDSQSNWLQPVYHAAQQTANGGISAPDPTHPVLQAPNPIDYKRYLDNGRAWRIDDDAPFTHILNRGSGGGAHEDTLAVSEPGAYNDGTVVLTSYMAGALTNPQDDTEAKRFMHNLLSQSYTMLFLDFGPPLPAGVPIGTAQRLVAVPHPNVPGAVVEVRIVMYAWNGG